MEHGFRTTRLASSKGGIGITNAILSLCFMGICCATPRASAEIMASRKRKQISLSDKMKLVRAVAHGEKHVDVAKAFGLSKQTVSSIVRNKGIAGKQALGELYPKRFSGSVKQHKGAANH